MPTSPKPRTTPSVFGGPTPAAGQLRQADGSAGSTTHSGAENESRRVAAVRRYDILDSPPDGAFDAITSIAARLFSVPISIVSIVDTDRIWFKSHPGVDVEQIGREPGLCASAILQEGPWVIADAAVDARTLSNPLVAGELGLRFYAGVPLRTRDGYNLGTLCIIDKTPRTIDQGDLAVLEALASMVVDQMELRLAARELLAAQAESQRSLSELMKAEQRELNEKLSASENQLQLVDQFFASINEGILTVAPDGRCTAANHAALQMLGYAPEEIVGCDLHPLIHDYPEAGDVCPVETCTLFAAMRGQRMSRKDEVFLKRDGTRLRVSYSCTPPAKAGRAIGMVLSFVDASQQFQDPDEELHAAELRAGIAAGQFVVHYQPKIELITGRVTGVEALARWNRPGRGLVFPDEFIPIVERGGMMTDLTTFVLNEAARQHHEWRSLGLNLPIAVNVTAESVGDLGLPAAIADVCRRHEIDPWGIELEVTENVFMSRLETAATVLTALAHEGITTALDDFGTGFSSLACLRNLPVSAVKIDKSFVRDINDDDAAAHMVRGTIELVHGLGKRVVAEGVENQQVLDLLLLMHCDQGQGHHWSLAIPGDQLATWVQNLNRSRLDV